MSTVLTMKSMFDLLDVPSWVEDFDSSTKDAASRARAYSSFVLLPELDQAVHQTLDRIHRGHGRGFLVTGLYGSGKTLFMAYLSAVFSEPTLLTELLNKKPEWGLDDLTARKYLTINFTAIANQDMSLEESLWDAVRKTLQSLSPPIDATISDVDNFLEMFELWGAGSRRDVEEWLEDKRKMNLAKLKTYDRIYQKQQLDAAMTALGMKLEETRTTLAEKVQILIDKAKSRGYDGVAVFIDELYLHLIQSDEIFNKDTAFLSQLAQAGLAEGRPFWIFAAMQEEIQAIARHAGRNYNTELMGRLAGEGGRFENINLPVTQFHRIYNHRLFRDKSKKIHKLADLFTSDIQPHYRNSFLDFFRRYFRNTEPVTDEAKHFADVYPVHPYAMHCLTKITNSGGRSRGALGYVDDFCHRAAKDGRPWNQIALLDDVFDYEDLRNKIIQANPDIQRFYELFDRLCAGPKEEVLNRAPYRRYDPAKLAFVGSAADRLIKGLIVLAMVKEELTLRQLTDALMLRWPGKEHQPAESDEETVNLLEKISHAFPPLRKKGTDTEPTYYLSVEGDGGERDELRNEIERVVNSQASPLEKETAYRSQLNLYLSRPGPLGGSTPPPQTTLKTELNVTWQRTRRSVWYMLEAASTMKTDATVSAFLAEVPASHSLHQLILYPAASPLDVEMDKVTAGDGRVLVWLPATLEAQDVETLRRSMALTRLHADYIAKVQAGQATLSDKRKLEIIGELLGLPTAQSEASPSHEAITVLNRAYMNGRIYRWNPTDKSWEELYNPGQLLAVVSGIPEESRSLATVVEKFAADTLSREHPLHPDFQNVFSFSADLSTAMQRRVLQAVWKGRATEEDGQAKGDLEKHLGPLGLLDTTRPGEAVVAINAASHECFRKIRDRVRDRLRKSTSDPKEVNVVDLRDDLGAKDTGLTPGWIDVSVTLLLTLGDVTGVTAEGERIAADKKDVGEPKDWLPKLTKLRAGGKPDDALWKDVVRSMQALDHWEDSIIYTPLAADKLHEKIVEVAASAEQERNDAQETLAAWPGAIVPTAVTVQADLLNVPPEARTSQSACFQGFRAALRDLLGLPDDDRVDGADRYRPVSDWAANELQAARDFLVRAAELRLIANQLAVISESRLPGVLATTRDDLVAKLTEYILSAGATGSFPRIKALWEDLKDDFRNQYNSEHAGLHAQLLAVQQSVLASREFEALKNFESVEGLSAHYSPARIEAELRQMLGQLGVTLVCEPTPANLEQDLNDGWTCSACHYQIGTSVPISADAVLADVQTGLNEYLGQVRGFSDQINTYVSGCPEASPLLALLGDSVDEQSLDVLGNETMRQHLANALRDAKAARIEINQLLAALKPRLLGTYPEGAEEFRKQAVAELAKVISQIPSPQGEPWKVE